MRERHPIDDIFRRGLAAAEVDPPAAVWEGVMHQRAGRRRLVVVWRRFRWIGLLALLVGGPILWWASSDAPSPPPADAQASTVQPLGTGPGTAPRDASKGPAQAAHTSVGLEPVFADRPASTTAPDRREDRATTSEGLAHRPSAPPAADTPTMLPGARAKDATSPEDRRTTVERSGAAAVGMTGGSAAGALIMAGRMDEGDAQWLPGRRSACSHGLPAAAPATRGLSAGYVLPHAEWWLAMMAARFDRTRRWQGTDAELVDARTALEGHAGEWHLGLWAGRRWRSGTWFGAGIEHTGGRGAYERSDRSQQVNALVNTSIAVFENTVLATQSDTMFVVQDRTETTAITGRSSTWRVPLMLGWERGVRRWVFGAHVGLALEWQRMRDGYLFREEMSEGGMVVQRTERVRDADRSFGLVSAQLALDGGFQLTEHWRITAGPVYQAGLGAVLGRGAVQALPTRLGGHVRLSIDLAGRSR